MKVVWTNKNTFILSGKANFWVTKQPKMWQWTCSKLFMFKRKNTSTHRHHNCWKFLLIIILIRQWKKRKIWHEWKEENKQHNFPIIHVRRKNISQCNYRINPDSPMIIILMARKRAKLAQKCPKIVDSNLSSGQFFSHVSTKMCLLFNGRHNYSNFHPKSLCAIISAHSYWKSFFSRSEQWRQRILWKLSFIPHKT